MFDVTACQSLKDLLFRDRERSPSNSGIAMEKRPMVRLDFAAVVTELTSSGRVCSLFTLKSTDSEATNWIKTMVRNFSSRVTLCSNLWTSAVRSTSSSWDVRWNLLDLWPVLPTTSLEYLFVLFFIEAAIMSKSSPWQFPIAVIACVSFAVVSTLTFQYGWGHFPVYWFASIHVRTQFGKSRIVANSWESFLSQRPSETRVLPWNTYSCAMLNSHIVLSVFSFPFPQPSILCQQ